MLSKLTRLSKFHMQRQILALTSARGFAKEGVLTPELQKQLKALRITNPNVVQNPT